VPQQRQLTEHVEGEGSGRPSHVGGGLHAGHVSDPPHPLEITPHAEPQLVTSPVMFGVNVTGAAQSWPARLLEQNRTVLGADVVMSSVTL
jgi:hypothetical protein